MKKRLLLLSAGLFAVGAQAQQMEQPVRGANVVATPNDQATTNTQSIKQLLQQKHNQNTAAKGTAFTGVRTYNYVDVISGIYPDILDNASYPYVWSKFNALGAYSGGPDTINIVSWGAIFDPYAAVFNEPSNPEVNLGTFGLTKTSQAYKLDSVTMYGAYGRNAAKPNVVDTMRIALMYGTGGGTTNLTLQQDVVAPGDTCKFFVMGYDSVRVRGIKPFFNTGTPPAIYYTDVLLSVATLADSTSGGLDRIRIAVPNFNVPAGNFVGLTATFISGDPAFTPYDTAIRSGANNTINYKYNVWRPLFFDENTAGDPVCRKGDYNGGLIKLMPLIGDPQTSYRQLYYPSRFITPSATEFPYIDFKVSSTQFEKVGVDKTAFGKTEDAYPNPAHTAINIPVMLNNSSEVSVEIFNNLGQVIRTQSLGTVAANVRTVATIATNDLTPGVYFYTVKTGAERITKRFAVSH